MKAEKDKKTGKWLIQYRYTDWQGNVGNLPKEVLRPKERRRNGLEISLLRKKQTLI